MAMELQGWLNEVLRKHVSDRENKVCVVSVVGKSPASDLWNKINPINQVLGRKAFENLPCVNRKNLDGGCRIDAYFDGSSQTAFFHLIGPYDIGLQKETYPSAEDEDFYSWWIKRDEIHAAHLLALFLCSHIVLLMHPTCRLDTSYFRLFRTLEEIRTKSTNAVCEILADTNGVSKGWSANGRLCAPRLLFGFHRPPTFMKADGTVETKQGSYRKTERSLEDQIYALFRKSRIVTNNSANALITLPANHSFVYVFPPNEEPRDFIQDLLNNFRTSTGKNHGDVDEDTTTGGGRGFKEFLMEHIELAHSEGFNDNLGKVGPAYFELPKLKSLVRGIGALYDYFVSRYNENLELEDLPSMLDATSRFSEGRCKKVLPMAISTYREGLPQYYSSVYHQTKLAQALHILNHQARGPSLENARMQLINDCEDFWRDGRQACEAVSLTGNPCSNRFHETDGADPTSMRHTSKFKFLSTCNCGRRQAWRDDPFGIREANYGFYEDFECCRRRAIDRIDYPIYAGPKQARRRRTASFDEDEIESEEEEEDGGGGKFEEKHHDDDRAEPKEGESEKKTAELFDRLKLATQSQEERHQSRGPSDGEDLLLDRDNKPGEFSSNSAAAFSGRGGEDAHTVKTQDDSTMGSHHGRQQTKSAGSYDGEHQQDAERARRPSSGIGMPTATTTVKKSVFSDILNTDDVCIDSIDQHGSPNEDPVAELTEDATVEKPADEGDEDEEESDYETRNDGDLDDEDDAKRRTNSRSSAESTGGGGSDAYKQRRRHRSTDVDRESDRRSRKQETERESMDQSMMVDALRDGVDYLSGMIHSLCTPGVLPLFSSWSLVCIGPSSIYSHTHGLRDQPNYSHGSNFLIPWDIQLQVDVERWHEQMDNMVVTTSKRAERHHKKPRQPKKGSDSTVTVKLFLGFEYECPRGHRFVLQSPDRILKHASGTGGGPKENGGILAKSDMPLWFPCSCRQAKSGFPGQLMRVHVVTPKAPVVVTLNPRLQPTLAPPGKPPLLFHPGAPGPAKLDPAQYWVLRLPFVYVGPDGPCYAPRDTIDSYCGRILRGMINVFPDLEL